MPRPAVRVRGEITRSRGPAGVQVVCVRGEVDYLNLKLLEPTLSRALAATGRRVVLDLERTAFLDPAAFALVLEARHLARDLGVALVVVRPRTELWRILRATGADEELPLRSSLDEALSALAAT